MRDIQKSPDQGSGPFRLDKAQVAQHGRSPALEARDGDHVHERGRRGERVLDHLPELLDTARRRVDLVEVGLTADAMQLETRSASRVPRLEQISLDTESDLVVAI